MSARCCWLGLAALLAGGVAQADGLDLVRAALAQFTGRAPVRAELERAVTNHRKDRPREEGRATFEVAGGPGGISIRYPETLIDAIRAERASSDPERAEPARRTIENFDATDVADLLNSATGLLSDLDGAVLRSETPAEHEGRPARLLELDLVVRVSKADSKWLKSASSRMKLWTDADGVPLAAETQMEFSIGLLIFTFDATDVRTQTFARVGDRLVAVRRSTRFDGSGFGETQHWQSDMTLRVRNGS